MLLRMESTKIARISNKNVICNSMGIPQMEPILKENFIQLDARSEAF